jgi:hypothetical protein
VYFVPLMTTFELLSALTKVETWHLYCGKYRNCGTSYY